MNRKVVAVSALVVLSTCVATGCSAPSTMAQAAREPAAPVAVDVTVVTARLGGVETSLEISGALAPRSRVAIKPRLPGTLERVLVDIGDAVTQGQAVATMDRREIDAQADAAVAAVSVAKAALESAEASLASAVLELDRAKNLFDKGALPRQRLDAAQTANRAGAAQRDLAAANLAQAEAALRRVREIQRDTTITSPVTGFVVERNYDAGAIPGDRPVLVVADLRQMKLEAGVSELEAGRLRVGLKAIVSVQAKPGRTFAGELVAIAPEVDERNRHFKIDVRVPNDGHTLLSGMYASARIVEASEASALLVPRDAVTTLDGRRVVLKLQGDTVSPVTVTEGLASATHVQIVTGLAAGDKVVADARRPLPGGTKVRAVE